MRFKASSVIDQSTDPYCLTSLCNRADVVWNADASSRSTADSPWPLRPSAWPRRPPACRARKPL